MSEIVTEVLKYAITIFMCLYTLECFFIFRHKTEKDRSAGYARGWVWMLLVHAGCYVSLWLHSGNIEFLFYFGGQTILLIAIIVLTEVLYPKTNRLLTNNMSFMLGIGFVFISRLAEERLMRQFFIVLISVIFIFFVPLLMKRFKEIKKLKWIYAIVGVLALLVVLVLGAVTNGSKISFSIARVGFQPSEFVKILFVLFLAAAFSQASNLKELVITGAVAGTHILILALSKDLGSAVIFFAVYVIMVFVVTGKKRYLFAGIAGGIVCSILAYVLFSHVRVRVQIWMNPWDTIDTGGFQIAQSLFALSNGGWFGTGLYEGRPLTIPYVTEDFIFSAIVEEMGLIFGVCLILICLSCFLIIFDAASKMKDRFYGYLSMGIGVTYIFQIFLTIGGGTKFIPLTGVTLPLISYGGSSVLTTILMFGIVQGCIISNSTLSVVQGKRGDVVSFSADMSAHKKKMLHIAYFFTTVFLMISVYTCIYVRINEVPWSLNSYNTRLQVLQQQNVRGTIFAKDGEILATTTVGADGTEKREYPYDNMFAHAVGFSTNGYTGVENLANYYLLHSNAPITEKIENDLAAEKNAGDNVVTTLDVTLQSVAYSSLGSYDGAIIVTNPKTGEILAMVSKPDFDPNNIDTLWSSLVEQENSSVLLNRATQGLYPPGSTFKMITALEYIKENPETYNTYQFDCTGKFEKDDSSISCYNGKTHGEENLIESFAHSCNSSFANIGTSLDKEELSETLSSLMFNEPLPISFPYSQSKITVNETTNTADMMQFAIGQGTTQMTPMHLNMLTAAIANDGVLMKPYVIASVQNVYGVSVKEFKSKEYKELLTEEEADIMTELMSAVVEEGTAKKLSGLGYSVAGKTGSAEYESTGKQSHAWFTGFAPADDPEICVTVIVEGAGSGGDYAVPVAKKIFEAYFDGK